MQSHHSCFYVPAVVMNTLVLLTPDMPCFCPIRRSGRESKQNTHVNIIDKGETGQPTNINETKCKTGNTITPSCISLMYYNITKKI